MSGLIRPSAAGPIDPLPEAHESFAGLESLKWSTAPTEMTFLAQAWGRDIWVPAFD